MGNADDRHPDRPIRSSFLPPSPLPPDWHPTTCAEDRPDWACQSGPGHFLQTASSENRQDGGRPVRRRLPDVCVWQIVRVLSVTSEVALTSLSLAFSRVSAT